MLLSADRTRQKKAPAMTLKLTPLEYEFLTEYSKREQKTKTRVISELLRALMEQDKKRK